MSAFSVKEWWSAQSGSEEDFDMKSLCVISSNIVVTASLQGWVRGFRPHRGDYSPQDLIFELQVESVLQIESGAFSHMSSETLAILHPRSLEVFSFHASGLRIIFELKLQRNAFNFAFGKFGTYSDVGRDFICIQSSDGALGFYEQENYLFAVQLPGFLSPGPFLYCNSIDSFLLCNSNMQLECYKYSRLKEAAQKFKQGSESTFECEWKINIGEYAQDIQLNKSKGNCDAFVLGEHTLYGIKFSGHLKMQKKLDYVPSCMVVYSEDMVLIGSFSGHLLVYKGRKLLWAARMNSIPILLKVESFDMKGLVLSLDEKGLVEAGFLGTIPMPYIVTGGGKNIDPIEADKEYRKIIMALNEQAKAEPTESMGIVVQVQPTEYIQHIYEGYASTEEGTVITTVRMGLKFVGDAARNVCIHIATPENVECIDSPLFIPLLKASTPAVTTLKFLTKPDMPSSELSVQVNVTYMINESPRTATQIFNLPLFQVAVQTKLQKDADFKITLTAKDPLDGLASIFPDFSMQSPNAVSIAFFDGSHATAILGKSGERCRIQASHFHALWLLTSEFTSRVGPHNILYDEPLPLQDFFSVIDSHFEARKSVQSQENDLSKLTEQYTAIQKRLLVRFKDKNPAPLNNLDYLLQLVHSQVAAAADNLDLSQEELSFSGQRLSCAINLILELLRFRFNLDDKNMEVMKTCLSSHVQNYQSGWEECANAALTYLLRTKLAKSSKESSASQADLQMPVNTEKLKKHVTIVFDRISKGARLV